MALSRMVWIAIGLVARLVMIAALAMCVQLKYANHTNWFYRTDYIELQSYTYAVAAAAIGMAGGVLQTPVAVYLLCNSKRMASASSVLVQDISMYIDIVVTVVLASGVGAGFGATDDVLKYINHVVEWNDEDEKRDFVDYYHRGIVPIVFLLVGMVLSTAATVVSTRLRARATKDGDDL